MKITNYQFPKSSFLSVDKDMSLIVNYILKNERLKRLLHYTTKNSLDMPKLTEDESLELFGKNIKIVPQLVVDGSVRNYIIINFDNFATNNSNPYFRDNLIEFDIICHYDQWQLEDFQLRPYRIAAELDSMLNGQRLTGIGKLEFVGASQIPLTNDYAGLCLIYSAIHGDEDKLNAPKESEQEAIDLNFDEIFNK